MQGARRAAGTVAVAAFAMFGPSCDAILSIEEYEAGPPADSGAPDVTRDARKDDAGIDCGSTVPESSAPSCTAAGRAARCGPACASCCSSAVVTGGTFDRSFDGLSPGYTSTAFPATVSSYRLDAFEITVGRFRSFVAAVVGGWTPAAGSGKHVHLHGGNGLNATSGGYETGWDASWNGNLATTSTAWNTNLTGGTWTELPGASEDLAITQIDWYEAYAFCIYDGGFLPSEAEWNYAAAGGSEQRARPFSRAYPPGSTAITCSQANYSECPARGPNAVGSESPKGDGRWGQSDLVGNVWEWVLDWHSAYVMTCSDCANVTLGTTRGLRGGSFHDATSLLLASDRYYDMPAGRAYDVGARCARTP